MKRWNYVTRSYEDYSYPADWNVCIMSMDMHKKVSCAGCGAVIKHGEAFTSRVLHNNYGIGYDVCSECYERERAEEQKWSSIKRETQYRKPCLKFGEFLRLLSTGTRCNVVGRQKSEGRAVHLGMWDGGEPLESRYDALYEAEVLTVDVTPVHGHITVSVDMNFEVKTEGGVTYFEPTGNP